MNSIVLFVNKKQVSTVILTNITFVSALPFVHEHPCYAIRSYTTNLLFRILLMTDHTYTGILSDSIMSFFAEVTCIIFAQTYGDFRKS